MNVTANRHESVTRSDIAVSDEDLSLNVTLSPTTLLKEIGHVTTSSGRSAINVAAAPSYNLTPRDMAFQGITSWRNILNEAPGISVTGFNKIGTQAIPGAPLNDAIVSIRGSLPYETAMMIDNMPMFGASISLSGGGGVDLAPYDPNAFSAFDVVSGPGAESPSILNAVGGSLNLHPAGQVTQNRYSFSFGDDPYGGWQGSGVAALRIGRLSVTATYALSDSPGPYQTPQMLGAISSSIYTIDGAPYACSGCTAYIYPQGATAGIFSGKVTPVVGCCLPSNDMGSWTQHSESVSAFYQLSNSVNVAAFYAENNQFSHAIFASQAGLTLGVPAGSLPSYTGAIPNGSTTIEPFCPYNDVTDYMGSELFEGKINVQLARGQLQVAVLSNESHSNVRTFHPGNAFPVQLYGGGMVCASPPCTGTSGANPFTPVTFNGETYQVRLTPYDFYIPNIGHNRDVSANYATPLGERARATVSYVHSYEDYPEIEEGVFGLLNATTGLETNYYYNAANATIVPSSAFQTTDQYRIGFGLTPSDRTSIDLAYYITGTRFHVPTTSMTAFGDLSFHNAAPRASFVWRPNSNVSVRASMGAGYAIAPLNTLLGTPGVPPSGCPPNPYCTISSPNLNLQPETSWGYDVGFDLRIERDTILSFDAYLTNLRGQFYTNSQQIGLCSSNPACPTGQGLDPLYVTQARNLGQSRYEGLELNVHRDVAHGIAWTVSGSLQRAYIVNLPPGFYNAPGKTCDFATGAGCANQGVLPNVNFGGAYSGFNATAIPYAQGFGLIGYMWSPEKFINLQAHYFGNNNGYFQRAFMAFDASAQVPLTRNVSLQGIFKNLTGIHDETIQTMQEGLIYPTAYGSSAYLLATPYGPRTFLLMLHVHSL